MNEFLKLHGYMNYHCILVYTVYPWAIFTSCIFYASLHVGASSLCDKHAVYKINTNRYFFGKHSPHPHPTSHPNTHTQSAAASRTLYRSTKYSIYVKVTMVTFRQSISFLLKLKTDAPTKLHPHE